MNRLNESTSLYLRQHADNPVDWHPWDDTALTLARENGLPILLSIGYSACHWCHVMAHESFEDPETAALMNRLFINIKLDREERPDLDKLYQLSHQLLSKRGGGWPLTVFLDPDDLTPFFAGTYFPPAPRHGLPAFREILEKLRAWFDENRESVKAQNLRLKDAISQLQQASVFEGQPDDRVFSTAFDQLKQRFDAVHGGFGGAPKFPQAPMLELLSEMSRMGKPWSGSAQTMLNNSLKKMALSGLRDHLDGGFFRYTVDQSWTIPHFEKMLYDNAMLLPLYAEAARATNDPLLREAAEGIAGWLIECMRDRNGGFYASMDADADGVEGGFHVWHKDQLGKLLTGDEYAAVEDIFGLNMPANFEGSHWHLVRSHESGDGLIELPESARQKMLESRALRTPPATDTKQLTSWNALCIEGFARAGSALNREDWVDIAEQSLAFIRKTLWKEDGLYAVHAGGKVQFHAYLDDHAYLLKGILSLLEARWDSGALSFAVELAEAMLGKFQDAESGGFFFSAADQESPITRLRPLQDDATPGGNGIAVFALEKLGHLTSGETYLEAAGRALISSYSDTLEHPLAHATLLVALNNHLEPPTQVIVTGVKHGESKEWKAVTAGFDRVNCYVFGSGKDELPSGNFPSMADQYASGSQTLAYVCEGLRCLPPVTTSQALQKQLESMD